MNLAIIDHDRGKLNEQSLEMLTLGRGLGADLEAVVIGESGRELAGSLGAYGVTKVHLVLHEQLDDFAPSAWARSVGEIMASESPAAVLAPGSERGNEVLAHLAAQTNLPMAANCTEVQPGDTSSDDGYQVTRVRWGGSLLEEALLKGATKLLSVAPLAVIPAEADAPAEAAISEVSPSIPEKDLRVRVTSRVQPETDKVSLTDAPVVVSGGRGVGSTEGFESLDELASLLGGAVGCSRAVTNEGWRPHADQVGQTGARVSPELYIACGISGAIQHYAGCKGSDKMLVINTDPDAPIISKADYVVIGDLHKVVPAVADEVRKVRG